MKKITKALVEVKNNEIVATLKEMNGFIPINRYLDQSGHYDLASIESEKNKYLIVVLKEEYYTKKTKVLFGKVAQVGRFDNITEEDIPEILELANSIMKIDPLLIQ